MRALTALKWLAAGLSVLLFALAGLLELDRAFPPPLGDGRALSVEVADRNGDLLRAYATPEGHWRLPVKLVNVDPDFLRMFSFRLTQGD